MNHSKYAICRLENRPLWLVGESIHQKSAFNLSKEEVMYLFCTPGGKLHRCLPRSHAQQAPPCWGYKVAFLWNAGGQTFRFWKLGKFYIVQQVSGFFSHFRQKTPLEEENSSSQSPSLTLGLEQGKNVAFPHWALCMILSVRARLDIMGGLKY